MEYLYSFKAEDSYRSSMHTSVAAFELGMSLLADLTEDLLLGKLDLILRLNQVDLGVPLDSLGGNAITLLLLNVSRCFLQALDVRLNPHSLDQPSLHLL